jgi:hypothetical protein
MTKHVLAAVFTSLLFVSLAHAGSDCEKQAADKKLSGMAKMSFIAKCEKTSSSAAASPAVAQCEKQAEDKKLIGAAKTSFVKKCAQDVEKAVEKK